VKIRRGIAALLACVATSASGMPPALHSSKNSGSVATVHLADLPTGPRDVSFQGVVSTGRRNTLS